MRMVRLFLKSLSMSGTVSQWPLITKATRPQFSTMVRRKSKKPVCILDSIMRRWAAVCFWPEHEIDGLVDEYLSAGQIELVCNMFRDD